MYACTGCRDIATTGYSSCATTFGTTTGPRPSREAPRTQTTLLVHAAFLSHLFISDQPLADVPDDVTTRSSPCAHSPGGWYSSTQCVPPAVREQAPARRHQRATPGRRYWQFDREPPALRSTTAAPAAHRHAPPFFSYPAFGYIRNVVVLAVFCDLEPCLCSKSCTYPLRV